MKDKLILLVDADADCGVVVLEAAARTSRGVRLSRDSAEAFHFLTREFDRIDSIIVDVDPGSHGMALLEAVSALHRRPPIIVLTALEESDMEPVVARHGAAACLGKPISIDRLRATIDRITGGEERAGQEIYPATPGGIPRPKKRRWKMALRPKTLGPRPARLTKRTQTRPRPRAPKAAALRLRRILVPTDFSPAANAVLPAAVKWCERFGAELHLVHVCAVAYYTPSLMVSPVVVPGRADPERGAIAPAGSRAGIRGPAPARPTPCQQRPALPGNLPGGR